MADEEVNNLGMQQVVRELWPSIGCSAVVNEGGLGIRDAVSPGQTFFAVSVAEKGCCGCGRRRTVRRATPDVTVAEGQQGRARCGRR